MSNGLSLPEFGDSLNAAALIVALVALLISIYSWRTADRGARNDLISQVRDWAGDVIDALSSAAGLCALTPEKMDGAFFLRRSDLMSTLSALLDRGRMFFPNTYRDSYGTHKLPAFRGLRPQILDVVLLAYELSRTIDYVSGTLNDRRRDGFVEIKKVFVSAVQDATSFAAPSRLLHYEAFLSKIVVHSLATEIRVLAKAEPRHFQLRFDP
jgi:uncharacterized protein YbbC (DUF1343 family)